MENYCKIEPTQANFYYVIFEKIAQLGWISVDSKFPEIWLFWNFFRLDWNRKID